MRPLHIATAKRRNAKRWNRTQVQWEDLLAWLAEPGDRKDCGAYLLGHLATAHRTRATVRSRSVVTLDVDSPAPGFLLDLAMVLAGYAYAWHTTYGSTSAQPKYRVWIPLDRDADPDEYHALTMYLVGLVGPDQVDRVSADPLQYSFKPATADPANYSHGPEPTAPHTPLPVDTWLKHAAYDPDLSKREMPTSKRDPFEMPGVVGAFNRVYPTLEALVPAYELPYTHVSGDRWKHSDSDSTAGMGPVTDGLFYSHHANDPAWGAVHTSFDLVRVHRYGHLDHDADPDTPVTDLPSTKQMQELATQDTAVVREVVGNDFDQQDAQGDSADAQQDRSWVGGLDLQPRTGQCKDNAHNWELLRTNDPVLGLLGFNLLTGQQEFVSPPPWGSSGGSSIDDRDRVQLAQYLESVYRLTLSRQRTYDLILFAADRNMYNPLQDYLLGLEWDGEPRVETALPTEPDAYTRLVARTVFVGAVARALDPGCKVDVSLVLYGEQALGKTWWVDRMSKGYSAPLGPVRHKDTLMTMRRSWIMVSDEGSVFRNDDDNVQKEFLTRTVDTFRPPYGQTPQQYPRHCVVWATTNDPVFLSPQEGNRRFLTVDCQRVDTFALTDDYIDQVWAEAVYMYRNGARTFLTMDEERTASAARVLHTEEDTRAGFIRDYLETPVPADWQDMSPDARRMWLSGYRDGMAEGGERPVDTVCSAQLWVEAFGQTMDRRPRKDLQDITRVLATMPGWRQLPGLHRMGSYGPQRMFVRVGSPADVAQPQQQEYHD